MDQQFASLKNEVAHHQSEVVTKMQPLINPVLRSNVDQLQLLASSTNKVAHVRPDLECRLCSKKVHNREVSDNFAMYGDLLHSPKPINYISLLSCSSM